MREQTKKTVATITESVKKGNAVARLTANIKGRQFSSLFSHCSNPAKQPQQNKTLQKSQNTQSSIPDSKASQDEKAILFQAINKLNTYRQEKFKEFITKSKNFNYDLEQLLFTIRFRYPQSVTRAINEIRSLPNTTPAQDMLAHMIKAFDLLKEEQGTYERRKEIFNTCLKKIEEILKHLQPTLAAFNKYLEEHAEFERAAKQLSKSLSSGIRNPFNFEKYDSGLDAPDIRNIIDDACHIANTITDNGSMLAKAKKDFAQENKLQQKFNTALKTLEQRHQSEINAFLSIQQDFNFYKQVAMTECTQLIITKLAKLIIQIAADNQYWKDNIRLKYFSCFYHGPPKTVVDISQLDDSKADRKLLDKMATLAKAASPLGTTLADNRYQGVGCLGKRSQRAFQYYQLIQSLAKLVNQSATMSELKNILAIIKSCDNKPSASIISNLSELVKNLNYRQGQDRIIDLAARKPSVV